MYLSHIVTTPVSTATATKDVHLDTVEATMCEDVGQMRSALCSISGKNTLKMFVLEKRGSGL